MTIQTPDSPAVYLGVDVCSRWLDIHGLSRAQRMPNNSAGHAKLIASLPAHAHVILEASGGYEEVLWLALLRAKVIVSRVNPERVRSFGRALGILAKTDKIDAALLQRFGQQVRPAADVLPADWELQLQALSDRRLQLVTLRAQQEVQRQQMRDPGLLRQAKALIHTLNKQIADLEELMASVLQIEEARSKVERLQQMRGVGKVVSTTLLCEMPELGRIPDSRLCSLAGLAPHPCESGASKGQRRIRGGRHKVRRVLYMAALHCVRYNRILQTFYQNLLKRGKPFKVAITAVMRKLLCVLNKLMADPHFQLAN